MSEKRIRRMLLYQHGGDKQLTESWDEVDIRQRKETYKGDQVRCVPPNRDSLYTVRIYLG